MLKHACLASLMFAVAGPAVAAVDVAGPMRQLAETSIRPWLRDPTIIEAVREQNARHAGISPAEIADLDQRWRAETSATDHPTIDAVLHNPLSTYLKEVQARSEGLYTEIFVMDAKGLNVGQSDMTSDYWQGDEPKWQETFPKGPEAIHIGEVEQDESTQTFQSQLSLPIVDPADGSVIGAVTVGVDVDRLPL